MCQDTVEQVGVFFELGVLLCLKLDHVRAQATQLEERCRYLILALNDDNYKETMGSNMSRVIDGCTA